MRVSVAVLMACHNRKAKTVRCIQQLLDAQKATLVRLSLYVVDDGSFDGTATAIADLMPEATILRGDGSLFWAAAMALAESHAVRADPDYLLWLNDDTYIDQDALKRLLESSDRFPESIMVGATCDPTTGTRTYGGRLRCGWHPQRFRDLPLSKEHQSADTFNGNVVLIPRWVYLRVGLIDGRFPHAYADDDYGLRATAKGIEIVQIPGAVGACETHPPLFQNTRGVYNRWRQLESPRGLPFRAQMRFLRRHGGWLWPVLLVVGYIKRLVF